MVQEIDQQLIMEDLKRDISRGIEQYCRCKFPPDYIADERIYCQKDNLVFEGRIISTEESDSEDLLLDMEKWLSSDPAIIARGELLKVVKNNTFVATPATPTIVDTTPQSSFPVGPVIGCVAVLGLITLTVAVVIGAFLCHKQRYKKIE